MTFHAVSIPESGFCAGANAQLTLNLMSGPGAGRPERHEVSGTRFTLGRGRSNDWVLPDARNHISGLHCVISQAGGDWVVEDRSTNGTFLNSEGQAIGQGRIRVLADGDRLRIDDYEIEVVIGGTVPTESWPDFVTQAEESGPRGGSLWAVEPVKPTKGQLPPSWIPETGFEAELDEPAPVIPDFTLDRRPAVADAVVLRGPVQAIPEGINLLGEIAVEPIVVVPVPLVEPALIVVPESIAPEPTATIQQPVLAEPREEAEVSPSAGLTLLLEGAGLPAQTHPDPEAALRTAGAALRAAVGGILEAMNTRASVRQEFRIDQTLYQPGGRNPLKFSTDDEDALSALLGLGRRKSMQAEKAVAEALEDLRLHELATCAALQVGVKALLAQLDPAEIERSLEESTRSILPGQRRARAWDAFRALHAKLSRGLDDDFDSVFGKAFAQAYEQALRDAAQHRRSE